MAVTLTNQRTRLRPNGASPRLRSEKRRQTILKALHDCVIERGYPKTTLANVARAAGMSPSHLLYYFSGTDAILAHFFADVSRRIVERLEGFRDESPDRQIHLLAELFFAGKGISKSEVGFMLECFGVAVHDDQLHREKAALDRYCKTYLQRLFERSPHGAFKARESAEIAYAILVGLRTAAYFDEQLGPEQARHLFDSEMLRLAQLDRISR